MDITWCGGPKADRRRCPTWRSCADRITGWFTKKVGRWSTEKTASGPRLHRERFQSAPDQPDPQKTYDGHPRTGLSSAAPLSLFLFVIELALDERPLDRVLFLVGFALDERSLDGVVFFVALALDERSLDGVLFFVVLALDRGWRWAGRRWTGWLR